MPSPAYLTQAQLEARFGKERVAQLFSVQDTQGVDTGVVDTTTLNAAIADASAEFDELMATVYAMPLIQVGGVWDAAIIEIVAIFTMHRGATLKRPEYGSSRNQDESPYYSDYVLATKRCEEMKTGKRRLTGGTLRAANVGGQVTNSNPDTITPFYFWPNPNDGSGGMSGF